MTKFLAGPDMERELASLGGWYRSGHELRRVYPAASHSEAMEFVTEAARIVGRAQHEPVFSATVHGRFVYVALYSPEYGGITDSDVRAAREVDAFARGRLRPPAPAGQSEAAVAPYADIMGAPEPAEERTDIMGGPKPDGEHGVFGGPEPHEAGTDVMGGPEGASGSR